MDYSNYHEADLERNLDKMVQYQHSIACNQLYYDVILSIHEEISLFTIWNLKRLFPKNVVRLIINTLIKPQNP